MVARLVAVIFRTLLPIYLYSPEAEKEKKKRKKGEKKTTTSQNKPTKRVADLWLQGLSEIKWRPKSNPGGKGINEWYYFLWSRCLCFREKHSFYSITFYSDKNLSQLNAARVGVGEHFCSIFFIMYAFTRQMWVRVLLFLLHNRHFEVWLSWEFQLLGVFNDQAYCAAQAPKDFNQFKLSFKKNWGNLVPQRPPIFHICVSTPKSWRLMSHFWSSNFFFKKVPGW